MTITLIQKVAPAPLVTISAQPFAGLSTPLEAAQAYHGHGMALILVPLGSKVPQLKDWPNFQCQSAELPNLFGGKSNIAVKLGAPSNGVIDIDLDTPEAVKLAPTFLPATDCVFGRKGKPRSHYIYSVADAGASFKRQAKLGQAAPAVLLELRSTGSLTVFPPSVHVTGEQIEFAEGHAGFPTQVPGLTLLRAVNELAVATLLARAWPKSAGIRNELGMAVAGGMLRSGVPAELVAKLLYRAAETAGDQEAKQRADVVLATQAKIKKSAPATGWPRVAELLGDIGSEVAQKCNDWLGLSEQNHQGSEFGSKLVSVLASQVPVKSVDWLWPQWLAYGALSILDGDPGLGKSTLCLDLAARVSTGANLPGGHACKAAGVVVISGEDSLATTVVPRLKAAGADLGKIRLLQDIESDKGSKMGFSIPEHLPLLRELILQMDARLVVIDPLMAYLSLRANSNSDQQVRQALMPLSALAEEAGAAILTVRHLNKQGDKAALYRGGGSIAMIGAARTAMLLGKDPSDPGVRILACNKTNLGLRPQSWKYRVVTKHVAAEEKEAEVSAIEWMELTDLTADQLLAEPPKEHAKALDEAVAFLKELLKEGPMGPTGIFAEGKQAGHSIATLRRAAKKLGIKTAQNHAGGKISGWEWALPETTPVAVNGGS